MPFADEVINKDWQNISEELRLLRDAEIIEKLGGPSAVAEKFGFEMPIGIMRVSNWKTKRGIPKQEFKRHSKTLVPLAKRWFPDRRSGEDRRARDSRCRGYRRSGDDRRKES